MSEQINNGLIWVTPANFQTGSISKLLAALSKFHKEIPVIKKDRKVPVSKSGATRQYSTLDGIIAVARPILAGNGLSVMQEITGDAIITTLLHDSGEMKGSVMSIGDIWSGQNTNKLQNMGGTFTYLRRYTYCAILSISSEDDDDGATGSLPPKKRAPVKKQPVVKKPAAKKTLTIEQLMTPKNADKLTGHFESKKTAAEIIKMYESIFTVEEKVKSYIRDLEPTPDEE